MPADGRVVGAAQGGAQSEVGGGSLSAPAEVHQLHCNTSKLRRGIVIETVRRNVEY